MSHHRAIPQLFELLRQHTLSELAQLSHRVSGPGRLTLEIEQDFLRRAQRSWERPLR